MKKRIRTVDGNTLVKMTGDREKYRVYSRNIDGRKRKGANGRKIGSTKG